MCYNVIYNMADKEICPLSKEKCDYYKKNYYCSLYKASIFKFNCGCKGA